MGQRGNALESSKNTTDVDAIKQVEQDMGQAMVAGDIEKLKQIYADDFATVGSITIILPIFLERQGHSSSRRPRSSLFISRRISEGTPEI